MVNQCMSAAPCAPAQPMREQVSFLAETANRANDMLEAIEFNLFGGDSSNQKCEKTCATQNVQAGLNQIEESLRRLTNKLDSIIARF